MRRTSQLKCPEERKFVSFSKCGMQWKSVHCLRFEMLYVDVCGDHDNNQNDMFWIRTCLFATVDRNYRYSNGKTIVVYLFIFNWVIVDDSGTQNGFIPTNQPVWFELLAYT